jgi:hypothetical protein
MACLLGKRELQSVSANMLGLWPRLRFKLVPLPLCVVQSDVQPCDKTGADA